MFTSETTRAVFINLPECTARCENVTKELACLGPLFGKVERVEAVRHQEGWRGCARSHVRALRQAEETYPENVQFLAVFEDDFIWRVSSDDAVSILRDIRLDFDVLILAFPVWLPGEGSFVVPAKEKEKENPHTLQIVQRGFWTTAYIVHRRYWTTLADHWAKETREIDLAWQDLQAKDRFFAVVPTLGNQVWCGSGIQNYKYRNFRGKVDMDIILVLNNVPQTDLTLARKLFKHVDMKRHPDIARFAQRFTPNNDVVICVDGSGVLHSQLTIALHGCWRAGYGFVYLQKECAPKYAIKRPILPSTK